MNERDIQELLKKADELRSLFVLGQRVIPFLEEIFVFVSEIEPLLDDINKSIEDNLAKMPNASKQLSKVTEATEMATTEIMDIVDGLVFKSDIISGNLKQLDSINNQTQSNPIQLLEILKSGIENGENLKAILPELTQLIDKLKVDQQDKFKEIINSTNDILQSISMDSSSIMMSLQVQDITSQQIAAVNHLLSTVQDKLADIMKKFQNSEISDMVSQKEKFDDRTNVSKMHRDIAFDPLAVDSISSKDFRQNEVDSYISEHNQGIEDGNEEISMEDIDALFGSSDNNTQEQEEKSENTDIGKSEETSSELNNEEEEPNLDAFDNIEEFSQDDIDALFGK